jgi:VIT1/CCC1 family predicted Fe2+/Mn2+ transporter
MTRLGELALRSVGTAVFGASDGLMSILGVVVFIASRSPSLVLPAALMGALSSAYSMGAGEFLSQRRTDWAAVPVMAAATFTGTLLPAVPYLWSAGWAALAQSCTVCLAVALVVGHLRSWRPHRYAETTTVIAFGVVLTIACNLLAGGGA